MTLFRSALAFAAIASFVTASQSPADEFEALRTKAIAGDASAQDALGRAYRNGESVPRDYAEALRWFRLASDQGLAQAQADVALMYEAGWGAMQDPAQAARLHQHAAEQGYAASKMALWLDYDKGAGVPQNYLEASRWCRSLAEQGDAPADARVMAQQGLGDYYRIGKGVTQDYHEGAARWYRLAADRGDARSQYYLGLLYGQGLGVHQDYVEAHKWLSFAAAQDYQNAAIMREQVAMSMSSAQIRKAQGLARDWKPVP